jgi:hypothetical protein
VKYPLWERSLNFFLIPRVSQKFFLILTLLWLASCANWGRGVSTRLDFEKRVFRLSDIYGETRVQRERGMSKGNRFSVKTIVSSLANKDLVLEKSVSISKLGTHKNGFTTLIPERSQFQVWYEKQRYFSDIRVDTEQNKVHVTLKSPEGKWRGGREFPLHGKGGVYCFYSQLIECIKVTGFMKKALKSGMGEMNFYIIWDGYPYFQHNLSNVKSEVISVAKFNMEGVNRQGIMSFNLEFGGQVIFFHLDKKGSLVKMFWIAQGISLVKDSSIE